MGKLAELTVYINLINPWHIQLGNMVHDFNGRICIETTTNLPELVQIKNKMPENIWCKFKIGSLVIPGCEGACTIMEVSLSVSYLNTFQKGQGFAMCRQHPKTLNQTRFVNECIKLLGIFLHTLLHMTPLQNAEEAEKLVGDSLQTAMHMMWAAVTKTLGISPGVVAFSCDMFLDIPLLANLQFTHDKKQVLINENLCHYNA